MQEWLDRAVELLYATKEILEKAKESPYTIDVLTTLATWDGTECDGYCLLDDITVLLEEIQSSDEVIEVKD